MPTEGRPSRPTWVDIGGLLVGVVSAVVAIFALGGGPDSSSSSSNAAKGKLSLVDTYVIDTERGPGQPRPHLEITLHNLGDRRIVIDRARIEIRRVYELRRCASQDDLPLSNTYGIALPVRRPPGTVLEPPLHQQLGPDEADRFALSLSADTRGGGRGSLFIFELDVSLSDDANPSNLHLGSLLIALPELPVPGEYYWGSETADLIRGLATTSPDYVRELRDYSMGCWRSNTEKLQTAFANRALRSAEMKAIADELVVPSSAAIE